MPLEIHLHPPNGQDAYQWCLNMLHSERERERLRQKKSDELNAEFQLNCTVETKKGKRKDKSEAEIEKVRSIYQPIADKLRYQWSNARRAHEEAFFFYAILADVPKSERMQHVSTHYKSTWSSQGWGDVTYARNAAQNEVDRVEHNGYAGVIRECTGGQFEILVNVETLDGWTILKKKPGPSLAEWLRRCWKRGVNPRVYSPFLPHGLEEKLGIDFQGNYK